MKYTIVHPGGLTDKKGVTTYTIINIIIMY